MLQQNIVFSAFALISLMAAHTTHAAGRTQNHRTFQFNCEKDADESLQAAYTLDISYQSVPRYDGAPLMAFGRIKNLVTESTVPGFPGDPGAGPSIATLDAKGTVQCPAGYVEGGCLAQFTVFENSEITSIQVSWQEWDEISAMVSLSNGVSYQSKCRVLSDHPIDGL